MRISVLIMAIFVFFKPGSELYAQTLEITYEDALQWKGGKHLSYTFEGDLPAEIVLELVDGAVWDFRYFPFPDTIETGIRHADTIEKQVDPTVTHIELDCPLALGRSVVTNEPFAAAADPIDEHVVTSYQWGMNCILLLASKRNKWKGHYIPEIASRCDGPLSPKDLCCAIDAGKPVPIDHGVRVRDVNSHSVVITGYRFEEGRYCPTRDMTVFYYDPLLPKEENPEDISYSEIAAMGSKKSVPKGPWNTSLVFDEAPNWYGN